MKKNRLLYLFCALMVSMALSACHDSSSGSKTPATDSGTVKSAIEGVVIDGYLKGAVVYSDQNDNKKWDDGEPKTTTNAKGEYTLEGDNLKDFPIRVFVGTDAVDSDSGPVTKPFSLSAPAPKDQTKDLVVTPITTLVQTTLEDPTVNSVDEAESQVRAQMGLSKETDLFADFVAKKDEPEYAVLYGTARSVAKTMADAHETVEKAAKESGEDIQDNETSAAISKLVMNNVMGQLKKVVTKVKKIQAEQGKDFKPAKLDLKAIETTPPDVSNISEDLKKAKVEEQGQRM